MTDDPDIAALKKANRRPLWVALGVVAGTLGAVGLWVLQGIGAVRAELEGNGYTDVVVKMTGPFDYSIAYTNRGSTCSGHYTRLPFSKSQTGMCFESDTKTPPPPARPENEVLADDLRPRFQSLPVTDVRCVKIEPGAQHVTCTLTGDAGAPLDLALEKSGDGSWEIKSPRRVGSRATLAAELAEDIPKKTKHPVDVDCGSGLFGESENDEL